MVPINLRDASYNGAKEMGHGKGYKYSHDYPMARAIQQYMPAQLQGVKYYFPKDSGWEANIKKVLDQLRR